MSLGLELYAARLPELGTPPTHAFVLAEVSGVGAPAARGAGDEGSPWGDAGGVSGERAPLCMALVIDASGSMRGGRFAIALQAARDLVSSLTPSDRAMVVLFDRDARTVVAPVAGDAEGKAAARAALDRAATGAGTNLAGGWREASDALSRQLLPGVSKRVVLLTDGLPSVGERDPSTLARMVSDGRSRGVETSVVGIGDGIDDGLCAALALAGEGRFHYLRDEGMLPAVVAGEVEGARRLAALDVNLTLAFSLRVQRAEVLHRYACRPDGRSLEVSVGAVSFDAPRCVLVQLEVSAPEHEALLGAAFARGRAVLARKHEATSTGYALGARASFEGPDNERDGSSPRVSMALAAGSGPIASRRRIAREVLSLRTAAEVRSAWEAFERRDTEAVQRRLGRARDLRKALGGAGLLDDEALAAVPDVDAVQAAMLGADPREARRRFTSWAHNTMNSQAFFVPPGGFGRPGGGGQGGAN